MSIFPLLLLPASLLTEYNFIVSKITRVSFPDGPEIGLDIQLSQVNSVVGAPFMNPIVPRLPLVSLGNIQQRFRRSWEIPERNGVDVVVAQHRPFDLLVSDRIFARDPAEGVRIVDAAEVVVAVDLGPDVIVRRENHGVGCGHDGAHKGGRGRSCYACGIVGDRGDCAIIRSRCSRCDCGQGRGISDRRGVHNCLVSGGRASDKTDGSADRGVIVGGGCYTVGGYGSDVGRAWGIPGGAYGRGRDIGRDGRGGGDDPRPGGGATDFPKAGGDPENEETREPSDISIKNHRT